MLDFSENIQKVGLENIAYILVNQKFIDKNEEEITLDDIENKTNIDLIKNKNIGFAGGVPHVNLYIDNSIEDYKIIKKSEANYYATICAED